MSLSRAKPVWGWPRTWNPNSHFCVLNQKLQSVFWSSCQIKTHLEYETSFFLLWKLHKSLMYSWRFLGYQSMQAVLRRSIFFRLWGKHLVTVNNKTVHSISNIFVWIWREIPWGGFLSRKLNKPKQQSCWANKKNNKCSFSFVIKSFRCSLACYVPASALKSHKSCGTEIVVWSETELRITTRLLRKFSMMLVFLRHCRPHGRRCCCHDVLRRNQTLDCKIKHTFREV